MIRVLLDTIIYTHCNIQSHFAISLEIYRKFVIQTFQNLAQLNWGPGVARDLCNVQEAYNNRNSWNLMRCERKVKQDYGSPFQLKCVMCGAHVNIYASNIVFGRGNEEKKNNYKLLFYTVDLLFKFCKKHVFMHSICTQAVHSLHDPN